MLFARKVETFEQQAVDAVTAREGYRIVEHSGRMVRELAGLPYWLLALVLKAFDAALTAHLRPNNSFCNNLRANKRRYRSSIYSSVGYVLRSATVISRREPDGSMRDTSSSWPDRK